RAMQQGRDLALAEADEARVESKQRVAIKKAGARGPYLEARGGDEALEGAKSLRQPLRIGKILDQEGDIDGAQAGAGALKPQGCGPPGVAQEDDLLAGRPNDNVSGRCDALDRQRGWHIYRGSL